MEVKDASCEADDTPKEKKQNTARVYPVLFEDTPKSNAIC